MIFEDNGMSEKSWMTRHVALGHLWTRNKIHQPVVLVSVFSFDMLDICWHCKLCWWLETLINSGIILCDCWTSLLGSSCGIENKRKQKEPWRISCLQLGVCNHESGCWFDQNSSLQTFSAFGTLYLMFPDNFFEGKFHLWWELMSHSCPLHFGTTYGTATLMSLKRREFSSEMYSLLWGPFHLN